MTYRTVVIIIMVLGLLVLSCGQATEPNDELAVVETNYGRFVIDFNPDKAPRHVANFKALIRDGFYDGTKIHRLVKNKEEPIAIQGGDPNTVAGDPSTWGKGQPNQSTVKAEFSDLKHARGVVSAARRGNDVDSATSQFFICLKPMPSWDGQYSVFGEVVEGMNVVDTIARAPLWPGSDRPLDPVVVNRIHLVKKSEQPEPVSARQVRAHHP